MFKKVIKLDEKNQTSLNYLGLIEEKRKEGISRNEKINKYFNQGIEEYLNSRYLAAIDQWRKVLEIDPTHTLTLEYIEKAKAEIKEEINNLIGQGIRYKNENRFDKAILEWKKVLLIEPTNKEAIKLIQEVEIEKTALVEKEEAIKLKAKFYLEEGIELYNAGKYENAISNLKRALIVDKTLEQAQRYIELAKNQLINRKKKEIDLSKELTGKIAKSYDNGLQYFNKGRLIEAIKQWEFVCDNNPSYENVKSLLITSYLSYGLKLYMARKLEESIGIWERILKIEPDNEKGISQNQRDNGREVINPTTAVSP